MLKTSCHRIAMDELLLCMFGCSSGSLTEMICVVQTYQGIDRCGERLAEEVRGYVEKHPALQRISVVGHSMGGLIARYALGEPSHLHVQRKHQTKNLREMLCHLTSFPCQMK